MAESSIKKNYLFSLINKLFAVLVPILVTPYLARVLNADGNGVISYINSISSYFILVANLGIETYGQRVIAIHRDDKAYLKKFFIEITLLRVLLTTVCLVVYGVCFISSINKVNNIIYTIFALSIFAVIFDFTWFFQGVENFRLLALTNIISKIIYIVLVLVFVKNKQDLNYAALFSVFNTILPFVLSMPFVFKYLKGKIEGKIQPFSHFKECMVYFIPTVAVQIYTVLDKTMIGLITKSDFENGYYEQAEKLVKLPLAIITALFIIMQSRVSYYYAQEKYDEIKVLINKSANVALCLSLPIMLGVIAIAPKLVPIYLGAGYDKCILLLYVFSPIIPIISISNLIATHYYTPFNKQKISNIFLISGAVFNIILNSFLIYFFKSTGAAIASVCAELLITTLYMIWARKFVDLKIFLKIGYKYLIAAAIMFVPVFLMDYYLPTNIWILLAEVGVGIAVYFIMLLILKVEFVYTYLRLFGNKLAKLFGKKNKEETITVESTETEHKNSEDVQNDENNHTEEE